MTKKTKPRRFADAMDRDDVRMREPGGRARLAQESLARLGGAREVRRQHLDGDVAVELHVAREVDDAHAAAAELALEGVLAGERGLEVEEFGVGMRHDFTLQSALRKVNRARAALFARGAGARPSRGGPTVREVQSITRRQFAVHIEEHR